MEQVIQIANYVIPNIIELLVELNVPVMLDIIIRLM